MSELRIDIIDGTKGKETEKGLELYRVAIIDGLSGYASARIKTALDTSGVPALGDEHPTIDDMYVDSREPELLSKTAVKIRLVYTEKQADDPQRTTIETGTSLRFIETNKDATGNAIILEYKDLKGVFGKKDEIYKQSGTYTYPFQTSTKIFRRKESSSPDAKSREYVSTYNELGWNADPTAEAGTWRCNLITGISDDGGRMYDVRYEFEYVIEKWYWILLFQKNGIVPDDIYEGVNLGKAAKAIYGAPRKNFNGLNLV